MDRWNYLEQHMPRSPAISMQQRSYKDLTYEEMRELPRESLSNLMSTLGGKMMAGEDLVRVNQLLAVGKTIEEETETAERYANFAIKEGGDDAEMHFVLGYAGECVGNVNVALEEYDKCMEMDETHWRAHYQAGKLALLFNAGAEAWDLMCEVKALKPDHAPTIQLFESLKSKNITSAEEFAAALESGEVTYSQGGPPPEEYDENDGNEKFAEEDR